MYRILIVEDDEIIARSLKKHLESWDYDVVCVEDFSDIMKEFAGAAPQLVLMDIKLPFYNGYHWCSRIREMSKVPSWRSIWAAMISLPSRSIWMC